MKLILPQEQPPAPSPPPKVTTLSQADLSIVRRALGDTSDPEADTLNLPQSTLSPLRGLPSGLYKEVVRSRVISQCQFLLSTLLFNISLILQVILGATVTALGSRTQDTKPITILAAANTVNAGLLALMHNSGLPERYKNDWNEFDEVEMFLGELMKTGVVREGWERDAVIADCFERYARAKRTVAMNKPAAYMSTASSA
jgi:hypothetical protein